LWKPQGASSGPRSPKQLRAATTAYTAVSASPRPAQPPRLLLEFTTAPSARRCSRAAASTPDHGQIPTTFGRNSSTNGGASTQHARRRIRRTARTPALARLSSRSAPAVASAIRRPSPAATPPSPSTSVQQAIAKSSAAKSPQRRRASANGARCQPGAIVYRSRRVTRIASVICLQDRPSNVQRSGGRAHVPCPPPTFE
jgi:hypothetical protein